MVLINTAIHFHSEVIVKICVNLLLHDNLPNIACIGASCARVALAYLWQLCCFVTHEFDSHNIASRDYEYKFTCNV